MTKQTENTNQETCECGHEKGMHLEYIGECRCFNFETRKYECPCKKFIPQKDKLGKFLGFKSQNHSQTSEHVVNDPVGSAVVKPIDPKHSPDTQTQTLSSQMFKANLFSDNYKVMDPDDVKEFLRLVLEDIENPKGCGKKFKWANVENHICGDREGYGYTYLCHDCLVWNYGKIKEIIRKRAGDELI